MAATLSLALGAPAGDPPAALAIPTLIDGLLQRTRARPAWESTSEIYRRSQVNLHAIGSALRSSCRWHEPDARADAVTGQHRGNAYWSDECATGREDVVCGGFTLNGEGSYLCDKHPSAVVRGRPKSHLSPNPTPSTADALRVRALTDEVHQLRAWKRSNCGEDIPVREPNDDGGEECPPWVLDLRAMARRLDECEKELAGSSRTTRWRRAGRRAHARAQRERRAESPADLVAAAPDPDALPVGDAGALPPAASAAPLRARPLPCAAPTRPPPPPPPRLTPRLPLPPAGEPAPSFEAGTCVNKPGSAGMFPQGPHAGAVQHVHDAGDVRGDGRGGGRRRGGESDPEGGRHRLARRHGGRLLRVAARGRRSVGEPPGGGHRAQRGVAWEVSVGAPKSGSATRAAVRGAMQGVFGAGPPIK